MVAELGVHTKLPRKSPGSIRVRAVRVRSVFVAIARLRRGGNLRRHPGRRSPRPSAHGPRTDLAAAGLPVSKWPIPTPSAKATTRSPERAVATTLEPSGEGPPGPGDEARRRRDLRSGAGGRDRATAPGASQRGGASDSRRSFCSPSPAWRASGRAPVRNRGTSGTRWHWGLVPRCLAGRALWPVVHLEVDRKHVADRHRGPVQGGRLEGPLLDGVDRFLVEAHG